LKKNRSYPFGAANGQIRSLKNRTGYDKTEKLTGRKVRLTSVLG
jgi:hypothetical protein